MSDLSDSDGTSEHEIATKIAFYHVASSLFAGLFAGLIIVAALLVERHNYDTAAEDVALALLCAFASLSLRLQIVVCRPLSQANAALKADRRVRNADTPVQN